MTTLKQKVVSAIAEHLADRVIETMHEYYRGTGIEPRQEHDLRKNLARDIAVELGELT